MKKEEVFRIMGKYYGNYYYRYDYSEHDLYLMKELLDEVNALGYFYCNFGRVEETEDLRIPQILQKYNGKFENKSLNRSIINAFNHKLYEPFVPFLLELYEDYGEDWEMRIAISNALLIIRSKKHIPDYVRIVNSADYVNYPDLLYELLCRLKVKEALPRLIELVHIAPKRFKMFFIQYIWLYHEPLLENELKAFLTDPDKTVVTMVKNSIKKL
nr:hypothetical protein [Clostridia bacterium]